MNYIKKNKLEYILLILILIALIALFPITIICALLLASGINPITLEIPSFKEEYNLHIPMGSIDAPYGGAQSIIDNNEFEYQIFYYKKDISYILKKNHFYSLNGYEIEDKVFVIKEFAFSFSEENYTLAYDNIIENLNNDYYYYNMNNEKGNILLIYNKKDNIIHFFKSKK